MIEEENGGSKARTWKGFGSLNVLSQNHSEVISSFDKGPLVLTAAMAADSKEKGAGGGDVDAVECKEGDGGAHG